MYLCSVQLRLALLLLKNLINEIPAFTGNVMINKRLLIKNLLAHNDENSFYDKKRKIDIGHKEGKAKFLKHICALSNLSLIHI